MFRTIYKFFCVWALAVIIYNLGALMIYDQQPSGFSIGLGMSGGILWYLERFAITVMEERMYGK